MQVWRGLEAARQSGSGPCVATIGKFDGVHRGHLEVLRFARARADEHGLPLAVATFDPHPAAVLRPDHPPRPLGTLADRLHRLAAAGVDATLVIPFTREFAAISAEEAVQALFVAALQVRELVVGADFRFGAGAAGDVATLTRLGAEHGFEVVPLPLHADDMARFSSTRVRECLAVGDVAGAAVVLGRPYAVHGAVVRGEQRGRELGFPTANLNIPEGLACPVDGVYAGWLRAQGARYPAAISVGDNPTFPGDRRRVEAYVLDRTDLDLYGREAAVEFVARIRDMLPFRNVADLVTAITQDVKATRVLLGL